MECPIRTRWRWLSGLVALLTVGQTCADNTWHTGRLIQLYPHADGSVALIFDVDSSTCRNHWAADGRNYYYIQSGSNGVTPEGARSLIAAAMTAHALGRKVAIYFDAAQTLCFINRLVVYDG